MLVKAFHADQEIDGNDKDQYGRIVIVSLDKKLQHGKNSQHQQREGVNIQSEDKVLDVNASMQGTLRFDDPVNLRISGNFEGTLDTKGKLMVGDKAIIKANITGEYVSIAGDVTGN